MCKLTRYEGSKTIEAWQCRVSGYVPAPMTVLRRFDCVLAASKAKVLAEHARLKGSKVEGEALDQRLNKAAGQRFHNHSPLDFERLKGDPDNIEKHILPSFGSGHEPGDWLGTGPRPNKGQQRESRHRVSPSCNVHGSTASLRAPNPKQSRWHSRSSTRNSTSVAPARLIEALYPWLSSVDLDDAVLFEQLRRPAIVERAGASDIRYIVMARTLHSRSEEHGAIAPIGGPGGAGLFGLMWWTRHEAGDLHVLDLLSTGEARAVSHRREVPTFALPAFILPLPIPLPSGEAMADTIANNIPADRKTYAIGPAD